MKVLYHRGDGELSAVHFVCQPVHLASCVDKDHCLSDGEGLVQVTQCVQLPLLFVRERQEQTAC